MGHSIFGWDLPPGCSVSDIPRNRPEDEAWDKIYDNFWDKERLTKIATGIRITEEKYTKMDKIWCSNSKVNRELVDLIDNYIMAAIEYGMEIGEQQAKSYEAERNQEDKFYHQERRNPKLVKYFKTQRQNAKELCEAIHYIIRELDKANVIKADSVFMLMPQQILAKVEG